MLLRTSHELQDLGITVRSASSFPASLVVEFTSDRGEIKVAVERPDWPDLSPDSLAEEARRQLLSEWGRRGVEPEE